MKLMMKPLLMASMMIISAASVAQQPGKCSPCQAAKSIRDALAQSIKDAAAAALAAGGSFSREKELDIVAQPEKCGCSNRTTRDELAQDISPDAEKCGCSSRTTRDQLAMDVDARAAVTVAACCEFCAQPGSLGCQGVNSARCNTCQQGLVKMSLAQATAAIMGAAQDTRELDDVTDISRAPREELADPCNVCGPEAEVDSCALNKQLNAIRCCCSSVAQTVACQGKKADRCCKNLKEKMRDVQDVLGDPAQWPMNIPLCQPDISTVVSGIEADVITWLKSIYVLLYTLHVCSCCPVGPVA